MKIAIMQPYLFPYIGYFQLINAVEEFVIYDDVNFIKGGWINRNKILLNGEEYLFTLPLKKASPNKLINEITIVDGEKNRKKMMLLFEHSYKRALYFNDIIQILKLIILNEEQNLAKFIAYSLKIICDYLNISPNIIFSSSIQKDNSLKGQKKVIEICNILKADHYINSSGGIELYDKKEFVKNGVKLNFLKTKEIRYKQFDNKFVPSLSIIDVMMFNSKHRIKRLLNEYDLV